MVVVGPRLEDSPSLSPGNSTRGFNDLILVFVILPNM